jgi:hypothetical protein
MNWNWEGISGQAKAGYRCASQVLLFLALCFYLLACVVAGKPVGPRGYVGFAYHCFQWRGPVATQAYTATEVPGAVRRPR